MKYIKEDKATQVEIKNKAVGESYIPVGSPDVKEMIVQGLYADKTAYIAKLFNTNSIYYLFIRPRRFGKSLLLDTIDQIAKSNKELFKGYAIYNNKTYKWKKYPVIWLNFSELAKDNPTGLKKSLNRKLYRIAKYYNIQDQINIEINEACEDYLSEVFDLLMQIDNYEPTPIILIDEYDSPLISCEKEQYKAVLAVLSSFFKVLKARQKDCKFIFVTGVTKFHLSGLTSGANSANDISLHEDYAEMLGYTEEDVDNLFLSKDMIVNQVLEKLNRKKTREEKYTLIQIKQALKDYYNGYCFTSDKIISVYNPDSILKFFRDSVFGNYWFNSGNPTILLQQIKNNIDRFTIVWDTPSLVINQLAFESLAGSLAEIPLLPLMYQTGYLTLDPNGYRKDTRVDKNGTDYYLKFPNQEVKSALSLTLAKVMDEIQEETGKQYSTSILSSLRNKQWSVFLNYIRSDCLAKAGYRFLDRTEKSFQRALYLFLNGVFHLAHGMQTSVEADSGIGRTDIVMEDHGSGTRTVYIFELKIDKPALEALKQIHSKDYSIKCGAYSKKVLIGLTCDAIKLNITEAIVEVHQWDDQNNCKEVLYTHFIVDQSGYFKEITNQA
ncbi:MAG: ATP-binding protein [Candidatus Cardinium sp.]|uniref:AAA family ATPase n=1 Tax=Cardinium endosymbiont of Dermatophagoides farinae TaxID=2597823 RepID=UPI00118239CF|nr:AAA family ATPase [Cardinium endosymbiont of Dermatophagoides farinae]TSJ81397.1 hypothetical protein FPG78_05455 [Cardinium endosymbiont of Dermatophagoides farinae]UWW97461.1 MAG: ATP-binding protein [Candidatus Cardinium sp.]